MNSEEKALKLIEDSLNKKCNGLECKVVKNNIDLRLENIRLEKRIDLYIEELICNEFDRCCQECRKECEKDKDTLRHCIKQYFADKVNSSEQN